jgi:hypothetical protein
MGYNVEASVLGPGDGVGVLSLCSRDTVYVSAVYAARCLIFGV